MNSVQLIGRLTRDPEVKYTPTQNAILNMSIAIDRFMKDGEKKTDFPRISVYGKLAENCGAFLRKGSLVGIQGSLRTSSYKKGDDTIFTMDVHAERVEFLDKKKEEEPAPSSVFNGVDPF